MNKKRQVEQGRQGRQGDGKKRSGAVGVGLWLVGFVACGPVVQLAPSDADVVLARHRLNVPSPAVPGSNSVQTLYYGSGTDRRRPEYRDSVSIITDSVDASKLINLGDQAKERNAYWNFTPKGFPLNARVWYPEGAGPFPLVLIVHGNHNPRDFSDPGYGYLGELLASRGYIVASIDMNFVNGGIRQENDARGWLLLQHVRAWRDFNQANDNPFFGKVDLDRVALIGHSRGGEAVGHAAAFNTLARYPDDASVEFDFNFGIKAIVAIAPVDGQYLPTGRFVPISDVSYLVFHGSHDGDVSSFHGLRQYQRVSFNPDFDGFKASVYVYRANHGQWNTVWGSHDNGPRSGRVLDLNKLMDPEDQRDITRLFISAFLDATVKGKKQHLPLFLDHRVAADWLPNTMYVTRYREASFRPVADFEEDIDVTTGTVNGVVLTGDSLSTWRENRLQLRSRNRPTTSNSQDNQAVWLGWNNKADEDDSVGTRTAAAYTIQLPESLATAWAFSSESSLEFLLNATDATPELRKDEKAESDTTDRRQPRRTQSPSSETDKQPIDLSVELVDSNGRTARLPVSSYGPIRRPLPISILRRADIERDRYETHSELVLQSFSIRLSDFAETNDALDIRRLRTVRFVFDRSPAGTVVLDDVGFALPDPAFFINDDGR